MQLAITFLRIGETSSDRPLSYGSTAKAASSTKSGEILRLQLGALLLKVVIGARPPEINESV